MTMKSNDEEYLDSLLNFAQSNNNNPQSALSRMASKSKQNTSDSGAGSGSGDISALIDNSGGNKDVKEIGNLLNKLDADEIIDDDMAKLLDDIAKPSDDSLPSFKVGDEPTGDDVRDPEEIALDEAIADAERMDENIKNGNYENFDIDLTQKKEVPEEAVPTPIIDESEDADSLLEMAPEITLPDDSGVAMEKESDADQTPEEILTDLLDDMPGNSLTEATASENGSLSDILDREQEQEFGEGSGAADPIDNTEEISDLGALMESFAEDEAKADTADTTATPDPAPENSDDTTSDSETSTEDLNALLGDIGTVEDDLSGDIEESSEGESTAKEPASGNASAGVTPGIAITEDAEVVTLDNSLLSGLEAISEDDINLDDLEASLDELIETDNGSRFSIEGEIAELVSGDAPAASDNASSTNSSEQPSSDGDISIPDLDALMNSLANDEVEDIESTAHLDEELGQVQESEMSKNDILGALTEESFDDIGADPSLGALVDFPGEDGAGGADAQAYAAQGSSRAKKEGLLTKLLKTLTEEDEETPAGGELASLTDENQQVLAELGEEEGKPKKKKKEKKPKKEKPPKEKKPKKEKPPKPKKEKKPKPPKEPEPPGKAMAPKKIIVSAIFAASLGILVCLPAFLFPERISSERADGAFKHGDYMTTYKLLHGKKHTAQQSTIYEQARVIAWAERYMKGYENYTAMNMDKEALDMLLMAKRNKDEIMQEAQKFNVEIQVQTVYDSIESLLSENYGLSEEEIAEINSIKKDRDYTIKLMEIVGFEES